MRKAIKIILSVLAIIITALAALYFLVMKGAVSVDPVIVEPNARTLYEGYVGIEPISLAEIIIKLEAQGCHTNDYKGERTNRCLYQETEVTFLKENGIEIYPHGPRFGPSSFYVTENKLWADKDIPGSPNSEKFKEEVRQDVKNMGDIVKIEENSWKITKTKYPWTVIY